MHIETDGRRCSESEERRDRNMWRKPWMDRYHDCQGAY